MKEFSILIDGLHKDNENSLISIHRLFNRKLLLFAKRYVKNLEVAEELVSDSFVKMWNNRYSFHTEEKLKAFLYICTKNACLNHLRHPNVSESLDVILNTEFDLSDEIDVYTKMIHSELIIEINKQVLNLSHRQQEVFNMTFFEGLSTNEIADKLNISLDVVYANRSRAIAILRNRFKMSDYNYVFCVWLMIFNFL